MKGRTTFILFAVLAALAAFVYFFEVKGKATREKAALQSKRLLRIEEEQIRKLTVVRSTDTLVVEREGEAWQIVKPVRAAGDKYGVKNLVSEVAGAKSERSIEDVTDWAEYGLVSPRFTLFAESKSGALDTLYVGDNNPTGSFLFVRKPGSFRALLSGTGLSTSLGKSVFDLRDKTVLPFEKDDIRKVEIRHDGTLILMEMDGNAWTLKSPVDARAGKSVVDDLLNKVKWAEAKAFENESPKRLQPYGLDPPVLTLVLSSAAGQAQKKLLLGRPKGIHVYAKDENRPAVFTVDTSLVAALRKKPEDFRDKKVAEFDTWAVHRAEIRTPGATTLAAVKDTSGDWRVDSPKKGTAKSWKLSGLWSDLSGLEAKTFIGKRTSGLSAYGLDRPATEVLVRNEKGDTLAFVAFGSRAGKDAVFAWNRKTGWVYTVKSEILKTLAPNIDDLLEKPEPPKTGDGNTQTKTS